MEEQKYWKIWVAIFVAFSLLGSIYYAGVTHDEKKRKPVVYSVILYQNSDNEWATLMDGINQAEKDFGVNIRYVSMGNRQTAEEQAALMEREQQTGASGILLAAADSAEMEKHLERMNLQIPVITIETGVDGEIPAVVSHITADNYQMGRMLGEKILEDIETDGGEKEVTVVAEYLERDSVKQRYQGLTDVLSEAGVRIKPVQRQPGDFSLSLYIGTVFADSSPYVAALDKFAAEEAAAAWESKRGLYEPEKTFKIYGIGNTAQTVNDLDTGNLTALVFQNEFNMGYNGIRALVEKDVKGYIPEECEIKFKIVTRDALYEPENERLLFPNE